MRAFPAVVCVSVGVAFAGSPARSDETFRICIGQYEHLCPTAKRAWFPCGTDPQAAARMGCTIHTAAGPNIKPFRVLKIFDRAGNRCGYAGFNVICIDK